MKLKNAALAAVLLALASVGHAQEQPATAPSAAEDLFLSTLQSDIDTAGYYELLAWCRSLGLPDKGTRQGLQQRLAAHYGLPPAVSEGSGGGAAGGGPAGGEPTRLLEITSARRSEYFTVQEADEDLVVLEGDVVVELREQEAVHRIRARRIVLNQTQNLLMAEGGIEYTLLKGAEEETFRGERLTFDVETWEGVFFGGGMEADRPVGGKTIRFRFEGQAISRLANDTVVLEHGTITSCEEPEDPHYSIRARRIWVLAPNEWAIANALLYLGRVPILYLPFFFHAGDEFVFHPAIGYRDREGSFVQTTTYLVGQKKPKAGALSFLAAAEASDTQYAQEREGLFLRPVEGEQPPPEGRFLKVLVDFYNRLGVFAGVQGEFPPAVSFRGGLARSRTVYQDFVGEPFNRYVWTPRSPSDWNEGWLFGLQVPFRFGANASWKTSGGPYSLAARFEYFSDPFFTSDFFNRSEELGLMRLVGMGEQATSTEGQKGSLTWELTGQADFSQKLHSPWLTRLALPSFSTNLLWQSRSDSSLGYPENQVDPARQFYYPSSQRLPGVSAQVEGTLLALSRTAGEGTRPAAGAQTTDWEGQLRIPGAYRGLAGGPAPKAPPGASGKTGAGGEASAAAAPREPEPRGDLPTLAARDPASFRLAYQVRPNLFVDQSFNSLGWTDPESVAYDIGYTSVDASGVSSLSYDLRILESLLALSGNLQYGLNYRSLYRRSLDQASFESKVLTSYAYNEMSLKSSTALTYMPFLDDPVLGKSSLSYALGWTLLRLADDRPEASMAYGDPQYIPTVFLWDASTVTQHQARASLAWVQELWTGQLSLAAELPERPGSISANAQFEVWLLKSVLSTAYREVGASWSWDPLVVQETLSLSDTARFTEELRFGMDNGLLEKSVTGVTVGGFHASLAGERTFPKTWNGSGWDAGAEKEFLLSQVSLGYKLADREAYFWKNRIRLQTGLASAWAMNVQEFTTNNLDFSFSLRMFVHEFLELGFTSVSYNNRTFRYFPPLAHEIGVDPLNPVLDLLRSFNFFDPADRYQSAFKLKSLSLEVVHHLHDWDLTLRYDGRPVLRTDLVPKQYVWGNSFSVLVQWVPLPEMRRSVKYEEGQIGGSTLSLRG